MPDNAAPLKADITRRLRCAEGHLRGVAGMLERGDDCEDIVRQLMAVQGALREVNRRLLKNHLEVCLREQLRDSNSLFRQRYMDEIAALYHLLGVSAS
jgi:DNA-binding FrmR family transcriptional regulator